MLLAVDVHYGAASVTTAVVGFATSRDETPVLEHVVRDAGEPAAYEPGNFFKREMPHLVRAPAEHSSVGDAVVCGIHGPSRLPAC